MSSDVQSVTAAAIVVLTLLIFGVKIFRPKKKGDAGGCGSGCGCVSKKKEPLVPRPKEGE